MPTGAAPDGGMVLNPYVLQGFWHKERVERVTGIQGSWCATNVERGLIM